MVCAARPASCWYTMARTRASKEVPSEGRGAEGPGRLNHPGEAGVGLHDVRRGASQHGCVPGGAALARPAEGSAVTARIVPDRWLLPAQPARLPRGRVSGGPGPPVRRR